jgi:hypothetical protein
VINTEEKYEYLIEENTPGSYFVISDIYNDKGEMTIQLFGEFYFRNIKDNVKAICDYTIFISDIHIAAHCDSTKIQLTDLELLLYNKKDLVHKLVNKDRVLDSILDDALNKLKE